MDLLDLTDLIIKTHKLDPDLQLKKPIRGLTGFTTYDLICSILATNTLIEAGELLGYSDNPIKQACRRILQPIFPCRSYEFGKGNTVTSWKYDLLNSIGYKYCNNCKDILALTEFSTRMSNSDKHASICKACSLINSKQYKYNIQLRTPCWSDSLSIREIYKKCPEGMHVDHIIPLNGKYVSGLHVPNNLQYLHEIANKAKGNRIDLDCYNKTQFQS